MDLLRRLREGEVVSHAPGEPFVLLAGPLTPLDPAPVGPAEQATIAAIGLADAAPVLSPVRLAGIGWRPLSPVHGRAIPSSDGGLELRWTRRARGGWNWDNGVDVPLNEQHEAYAVEFGLPGTPLSRWNCPAPQFTLSASEWGALLAAQPAGVFSVRQIGDRSVSLPHIIDPE